MITIYGRPVGVECPLDVDSALTPDAPEAVWIDLFDPTAQEEARVEAALGIDVPTETDRAAIEESARYYEERGALVLTATLLGRRDDGPYVSGAVTFVLADKKLVTVRKVRPRAFEIGAGRAAARVANATDGADVCVALLEGIVERLADLVAEATADANHVSIAVFGDAPPGALDLRAKMRSLGRIGTLGAMALESIATLERLVAYAETAADRHGLSRPRIAAIRHDLGALERTGVALQDRLVFVLDAAVGLVSVNQNEILKALSVATIAFVPPTLIASIFGMNFQHMTWFSEAWGPWVGFGLMIAAPAGLFVLAKWRRWF